MRNYTRIDFYLNELAQDPYPQPTDEWHTALTKLVIDQFIAGRGCESVLDVGCGEGFARPLFASVGILQYRGVGLGESADAGLRAGVPIDKEDFSFLSAPDESYDILFARHSLEHSPMPVLTLMEWRRVSKEYLCVVLPAPEYWRWGGRNHYSVMDYQQAVWLFKRSGWKILKELIYLEEVQKEYWFLLTKTEMKIA